MIQRFSLRRTIFILSLLLFTIVQAAVYFAIYLTNNNAIDAQINTSLNTTNQVFERLFHTQVDVLRNNTVLLAQDFRLNEALRSDNSTTVKSALETILKRGQGDLAMLLSPDLKVSHQAQNGPFIALTSASVSDLVQQLGSDTPPNAIYVHSKTRLYEMIIVPIQGAIHVGWLALGKELGTVEAATIHTISTMSTDLAFAFKHNDQWTISGLSDTRNGLISSVLSQDLNASSGLKKDNITKMKGRDYRVRYAPFPGETLNLDVNKRILILYTPMDILEAPYTPVYFVLTFISGLGVIILFIGSYFISDGVSKPISRLARAAENISQGDYRKIGGSFAFKETTILAGSFNKMVTAVKDREEEILFRSHHDSETGLPNRIMFEAITDKALSSNGNLCVVVAELQELQSLRIILSHKNVTDLIRRVAERLAYLTGEKVARLSTDSVCFILKDQDQATKLLPDLFKGFEAPFMLQDINIDVRLLYGIAGQSMTHEKTADLMLNAYSAIDLARASNKRYIVYDCDIQSTQEQHLSLMSDLREDIKNGHVHFAYQPKLDISSNTIIGAEALIRWVSPKHGFVSPEIFIPMTERLGEITQLTSWILGETIRQASDWSLKNLNLKLSINLSTRDLQNEHLPTLVQMLLREHKLPASRICLEVTESAVMDDMDQALQTLEELSSMDIMLSIDDYGTGYSSLAYLKKLPVQELKIDKAFVLKLASSEADQILVKSTIDLAHNLGLSVTAEGVEDIESLIYLKEQNCNIAQGYHISRPLPPDEFEAFIVNYAKQQQSA